MDTKNLPYGAYLCPDSIVWFDRRYRPIVRVSGDRVTVCDPTDRIEHNGQEWLYNDATSPRHDGRTRKILENVMAAIPELAAEVDRRNAARVSA
jgi:hypothetical protein